MSSKNFVSYGDAEPIISEINRKISYIIETYQEHGNEANCIPVDPDDTEGMNIWIETT